MIQITPTLYLREQELAFQFVRSSGPGGQNVNKVATAVILRFDALHSPSLPEDIRARLLHLAGRLAAADGNIIIQARRFRSQDRNREDALTRLSRLLQKAEIKPIKRKKSKPTKASKEKRLQTKRLLGEKKRFRSQKGLHNN
jgi:ribosome-associated protein